MRLGEYFNHTFISLDFELDKILTVHNNQISGCCLDKLFTNIGKRESTVVGERVFGEKLDNGTYTGVLGLLERFEADMYIFPLPPNLISEEPWLKISLPVRVENFILGHGLFDKKNEYFDLIQTFNSFGYLIYFSFFVCLLVVVIFCLFLHKILFKKTKFLERNHFFSNSFYSILFILKNQNKFRSTKIFYLFLSLFFWFTILLVTNTIKTNKVVVDSSGILKDTDDLIKTKKVHCFLEKEMEIAMAQKALKGSILYILYHEKSNLKPEMIEERKLLNNNKCILKREFSMVDLLKSDVFLVGSEFYAHFLHVLFCFYYNLRNNDNQKIFGDELVKMLESGISLYVFDCLNRNKIIATEKNLRIISNLEDLLDVSNIIELNIIIQNFKSILLIFFLINQFILILFCFNKFKIIFRRILSKPNNS